MDRKLLRLYQPLNAYSYNSDSLFYTIFHALLSKIAARF